MAELSIKVQQDATVTKILVSGYLSSAEPTALDEAFEAVPQDGKILVVFQEDVILTAPASPRCTS